MTSEKDGINVRVRNFLSFQKRVQKWHTFIYIFSIETVDHVSFYTTLLVVVGDPYIAKKKILYNMCVRERERTEKGAV